MKKELEQMKELLAKSLLEIDRSKEDRKTNCASLIDGNFMSTIFLTTFAGILAVTLYAFRNLYFAIQKKFSSKLKDEL